MVVGGAGGGGGGEAVAVSHFVRGYFGQMRVNDDERESS